jgi:hypothetical protein
MKRLECCVCGDSAKAAKQWFNRDTGYGLCGKCAAWLKSRRDYNADEFTDNYGREGVHWFPLAHKENDGHV